MSSKTPRWLPTPAAAAWIVGVLCVVFAYSGSGSSGCATCWSWMRADEFGLGIPSTGLRLPLWRSVSADGDADPAIGRFLPPDHRHEIRSRSVVAQWALVSTTDCGVRMPSEFAWALMTEPNFPDFVAARVADGTIDLPTVQALIAEPDLRRRNTLRTVDHVAFMHRGTDLWAAFRHEDPRKAVLWRDVDPRDRQPPGPPCPNLPPR